MTEKSVHTNYSLICQQTDSSLLEATTEEDCDGSHHHLACVLFSLCGDEAFTTDKATWDRVPVNVSNSCTALFVANAIYKVSYPGCSSCDGMPLLVEGGGQGLWFCADEFVGLWWFW